MSKINENARTRLLAMGKKSPRVNTPSTGPPSMPKRPSAACSRPPIREIGYVRAVIKTPKQKAVTSERFRCFRAISNYVYSLRVQSTLYSRSTRVQLCYSFVNLPRILLRIAACENQKLCMKSFQATAASELMPAANMLLE